MLWQILLKTYNCNFQTCLTLYSEIISLHIQNSEFILAKLDHDLQNNQFPDLYDLKFIIFQTHEIYFGAKLINDLKGHLWPTCRKLLAKVIDSDHGKNSFLSLSMHLVE